MNIESKDTSEAGTFNPKLGKPRNIRHDIAFAIDVERKICEIFLALTDFKVDGDPNIVRAKVLSLQGLLEAHRGA